MISSTNADDEHPFGELTPEAFDRETSAIISRTHSPTMTSHGLNRGPAGFDLFVRVKVGECRARLQTGVATAGYTVQAVLSNPTSERYFIGEGDEFPADFARRLRREAKTMGATWLFVSMLAPFRVHPAEDEVPVIDPDDQAAVSAAISRGEIQMGLCWSATRQETDAHQYVGGVIYLDSAGFPERELTGTVKPESDPFRTVLLEDPCS